MNFLTQNLHEFIWIFITALCLIILAHSIKVWIARSQNRYVNDKNVETPKGLQELKSQNPVPLSIPGSNEKRNPPDWLKTQTAETIRIQKLLAGALAGANIGIISGMTVAMSLLPDKEKTAYTIIPGILLGVFEGIFLSFVYDIKLPGGRKVIVGAIIGSSAAVIIFLLPLGLLSKLLGIVVGAIVGAMLGWFVSKQVYSSRPSA